MASAEEDIHRVIAAHFGGASARSPLNRCGEAHGDGRMVR
jgi:hypothetical protein